MYSFEYARHVFLIYYYIKKYKLLNLVIMTDLRQNEIYLTFCPVFGILSDVSMLRNKWRAKKKL